MSEFSFNSCIRVDNGRMIGDGYPSFLVAELSGNHNGSYGRAVEIVRKAADIGADAVKLQTYTADTLTIDCDRAPFRISGENAWKGRILYDLYKEAYTPWDWHEGLFKLADELGIMMFSTPFDSTSVEFLEDLNSPIYKIASFELLDHEFIRSVAETMKPVIMSTGMASEEEVAEAVEVIRQTGNRDLVLLKCTSAYPSPASEMNIRSIPWMSDRFQAPVGLSDHCLDAHAALAAVSLGACVIEKHLTLDRADGGVDASFSLNPQEFGAMIGSIRCVEEVLGSAELGPGIAEEGSITFRRSIFTVSDIPKGTTFTRSNIRVIRPGHGLSPKHLSQVLGRKAKCDLVRGTPLTWESVD